MKQKMFSRFSSQLLATSILAVAALSACGPQAFVPDTVVSNQTAAGGMNIAPKVDIVLGVSTGGTMKNIAPGIATEIPAFVSRLENSGWDYRFVSIPLSEYAPGSSYPITNSVSVSHYHTNYPSGQWISPYPGASYTDPLLMLSTSLFSTVFKFPAEDTVHNDGHETGFENQLSFLNRSDVQSNFLRTDALLAVITLSNGEDRSGGYWRCRWNSSTGSYPVSCADNLKEWVVTTGTVPSYQSAFLSLKADPSFIKYYSLVSNANLCRTYGSVPGARYTQMAAALNGTTENICNQSLSVSLNNVSNHLITQKMNFRKNYLVIATEPNPGTIKVFKTSGGSTNEIAQDPTNGWTYAGYLTNQDTIEWPVSMSPATGYMIELHGTSKLTGSDTARVEYMNAGAVNAH